MSYSDLSRMAASQQSQAVMLADKNNLFNASEAKKQRDFEEKLFNAGNAFNAAEAARNRDWQEAMSNSAHQREVKDLLAAGLNPILSASGGNGAAVTSGATASSLGAPSGHAATADTSANAAIAQITGSLFSYMSNLDAMKTSAESAQRIAAIQAETQRYMADSSAEASRYASSASMYNAALNAASQQGINAAQLAHNQKLAEYDFEKQMQYRQFDRDTQKAAYDLQLRNQTAGYESQLSNNEYMAYNYPTTMYQAAAGSGMKLSDWNLNAASRVSQILGSVVSGVQKIVGKGFSGRYGKY